MAAVSLFWYTNMAAVTSCENTLFGSDYVLVLLGEKLVIFHSWEIRIFCEHVPFLANCAPKTGLSYNWHYSQFLLQIVLEQLRQQEFTNYECKHISKNNDPL